MAYNPPIESIPGAAGRRATWRTQPERLGAVYAFTAYFWWGLVPIYFKLVASVSAFEILAHRVIWSVLLTFGILLLTRRVDAVRRLLVSPKTLVWLAASSALIGLNWFVFIWAVANNYILETSLGYFINPLISVLLGVVLLGERLRPLQRAAVALATAGVLYAVFIYGAVPWIALTLACSFGLYGLLRKRIPVDAVTGLFAETALLAPAAIGVLAVLTVRNTAGFTAGTPNLTLLLLLAGPITTIPLIFFAAGVRRISLTALGFLQYISPTQTFLLAVFVYGEPFDISRLITFAFIWAALAVFTVDTWRRARYVTEPL